METSGWLKGIAGKWRILIGGTVIGYAVGLYHVIDFLSNVEFIVSNRYVSAVVGFLSNPPDWLRAILILIGVALIVWNERKRTAHLDIASVRRAAAMELEGFRTQTERQAKNESDVLTAIAISKHIEHWLPQFIAASEAYEQAWEAVAKLGNEGSGAELVWRPTFRLMDTAFRNMREIASKGLDETWNPPTEVAGYLALDFERIADEHTRAEFRKAREQHAINASHIKAICTKERDKLHRARVTIKARALHT